MVDACVVIEVKICLSIMYVLLFLYNNPAYPISFIFILYIVFCLFASKIARIIKRTKRC